MTERDGARIPGAAEDAVAGSELYDDEGSSVVADPSGVAGNPFVLNGLPAYAGLAAPAKPGNRDRRDRVEEEGDAYAGEWSRWLDDPRRTGEEGDDDPVFDLDDSDAAAASRTGTGGRVVRAVLPQSVTAAARGGGRVWPTVAWSLAVVATIAVIGAVVAVNVEAARRERVSPEANQAAASTIVAASTSALPASWDHATGGCTRTRTGSITIGADPGDHSTPQLAILGFEWAYYVERDAALARTFATPDARISRVGTLQAGIDSQPDGVRYCVYITAGDAGGEVWDVELHEQWPGDSEAMRYGQRITTTTKDGKALITGIARR
ncbi:hypothetical protein [Nocardia sp. NBC_01329]|uniref:hypothetical protein n=1 Tax=Nocardia sp. NBC_01329 TaxID=2903594 RepID=UPI002E13D89C|nr:hypothetical protein OG405_09175 [Nocardia sp. NBC_01329]